MVKKIILFALAAVLCLSLCSCLKHEHTYSEEWSADTSHHWHACTHKNCTETSDMADHQWSVDGIDYKDGNIIMTYACKVCGATMNNSKTPS